MSSRSYRAAVVVTLLVAAGLRFYGLTEWAFNNDEVAEVRWASQPFGKMMELVRNDLVHPPLDYWLQHLLWRADAPEWVRRVPAALFGIGTIALLMLLVRWWVNPAAGLIAGILLAVAPMHIRYSQEVRPYALGVFLLVAALVALERYARAGGRAWAILWFVLVLLSGGTLYFAGMTAGVTSLARIYLGRGDTLRPLWRRLPLIILGWILLYSPWLSIIFSVVRRDPIVPREDLTWIWWSYRLHVFGTGDQSWSPTSFGSWMFWVLAMAGLIASLRHRLLRVAAAWLIVCGILSIIVLQMRPHYPSPRYLMPAAIGAYALAGGALSLLARNRAGRIIASAAVVLFIAYSTTTLDSYYRGERSNWRAIARYVHNRVKPGETVLLANPWVVRNFGWYWLQLPAKEGVVVERFVPSPREFIGPVWVVMAQCVPRPPLQPAGLMFEDPFTEYAQVRFLRAGQSMSVADELCPE